MMAHLLAKLVSCQFNPRGHGRLILTVIHVQFCQKPCTPIVSIATLPIEPEAGMSMSCIYHMITSSLIDLCLIPRPSPYSMHTGRDQNNLYMEINQSKKFHVLNSYPGHVARQSVNCFCYTKVL